jgi:subtilisin family serine protease
MSHHALWHGAVERLPRLYPAGNGGGMTFARMTGSSRSWASWPIRVLLLTLIFAVGLSTLPLGAADLASPVQAQSAGEEVIVVLDDGVDPAAAARSMGVEVKHIYRHVFNGFAGVMTPSEIGVASRMQIVGSISPDGRVQAEAQILPDGVARSAVPNKPGTPNLIFPGPIDADIAILDTGIVTHPDLNVVGGHSCIGDDPNNWQDDEGHGTHVAGIAAAVDNDQGVVGVAPGARLWSVKVLDNRGAGTFGDVICGLDWVLANQGTIDVINLSLSGAGDQGNCNKPAFHKAVCAVVNAGIPVVVAAGNQGDKAHTRVPGSYPEVITVSAYGDSDGKPGGLGPTTCFGTKDDAFLRFSNYGPAVDIAAPGACILSLKRDGGLEEVSGTSEAAPHVAGAIAHFIARYTSDHGARPSPDQTRAWLLNTASRPQAIDGVTGDRDLEKPKDKAKKSAKGKHKGDKKKKSKNKKKNKKKHKKNRKANVNPASLEPVLWLEVLGIW